MPTKPEELTSQIDGITDTFTTTFHRNITQSTVFHNGDRLSSLSYSEPNDLQITLSFVPGVGDTLHIIYETDETFQGRVQGFPYDPSGLPPPVIPQSLQDILDALQQTNDEQDSRLDTLEAGSALKEKIVQKFVVANDGDTVFALTKTPVDINDLQLTLQGVEHCNGVDFVISGTTLTWQNIQPLAKDEVIIISYFFVP